ncbi:glycosyltransferase family 4 protein [Thermococcus henrietii]|uniref:glycosyltransferase family 4 protein n=1 Tax=Thermococcus henrietii TaxID=2016361 RepID=UPI000C072874|nr:glycosyltransferase family 4 protein [Thermococcus henrietii]
MKVIHLMLNSLTPYLPHKDPLYYDGDWHVKVAKQIRARTKRYTIECWRIDQKERVPRETERDNIKYRVFPSTRIAIGATIEISRELTKELIKETRQNDILLHIHGLYNPNVDQLLVQLKKYTKNVPIIIQAHGRTFPLVQYKEIGKPIEYPYYILNYIIEFWDSLKNIDKFFVLRDTDKEILSKLFGEDNVKIMPMGIDMNLFKPTNMKKARDAVGFNRSNQYILYVGRFEKRKGIHLLVSMFRIVHKILGNVKLVLVGEGPYKPILQNISRHEKDIILLPWKSQKELPLYYNATDLFTFPSLYENWPIAPLEALACKTPVLASPVGAIPRWYYKEKIKGIFIKNPTKPEEFAYKALDILNDSRRIKKEIPRNQLKRYSWEVIAKKTIDTYRELEDKYY